MKIEIDKIVPIKDSNSVMVYANVIEKATGNRMRSVSMEFDPKNPQDFKQKIREKFRKEKEKRHEAHRPVIDKIFKDLEAE